MVTNQSAMGRGIISEEDLTAIHQEMNRQLDMADVQLDSIYHCPVIPTTNDRTIVDDLDRKPGPGMLWQAGADLKLDVGRSWMVGDMTSDVLAGRNAGCTGILLVHPERSESAPEKMSF